MERPITCIYHKDCIDGTAAAAVVLKRFPNAQTFPLAHNYTPEEIDTIIDLTEDGAHLYLVDCTLGVHEFLTKGYTVTVIDHHISERTRMTEASQTHSELEYIFDNTKSGATLAWTYFFPHDSLPPILAHIEDNDLWKRELDDTEHVTNYLSMWNNDPHKVQHLFDTDLETIISNGRILTTYAHVLVSRLILLEPLSLRIEQHHVPAYNITEYQSACGNALSDATGGAVALYTILGNEVKFSFRSKDAHEPSALKLAMTLGGGGHRNASGATISLSEFITRIERDRDDNPQ